MGVSKHSVNNFEFFENLTYCLQTNFAERKNPGLLQGSAALFVCEFGDCAGMITIW